MTETLIDRFEDAIHSAIARNQGSRQAAYACIAILSEPVSEAEVENAAAAIYGNDWQELIDGVAGKFGWNEHEQSTGRQAIHRYREQAKAAIAAYRDTPEKEPG